MNSKFLTIKQAASLLNVSPDTLRRWEDKGIVTPQRTKGGSRRYTLLDLKIAKLNKRKTRFFQLPTLITNNYINSKRDLRIALLTSFLWIFGLLVFNFLTPVFLRPTNPLHSVQGKLQPEEQNHLKLASETEPVKVNTVTVIILQDQNLLTEKIIPKVIGRGGDLLIRRSGDLPALEYTDTLDSYYFLEPLPARRQAGLKTPLLP